MKKLLASPLFLLFMLLAAQSAGAEITQFEDFYVEVPKNWRAVQLQNGLSLMSPDGKCIVGISVLETGAQNSQEFARTMSRGLKGEEPVQVPGSSAYVFAAEVEGAHTENVVHVLEGQVLLFTITGDVKPYMEELNLITATMNSSNPKYSKMFK